MKRKKQNNIYALSVAGITAAAYAVLTLCLAPISYGAVQLRIAEALCVLPFLLPCTAAGLYAGCLIANIFTGNLLDIVFGSLATLAAALLTAAIGKKSGRPGARVLACLPPILLNAVVVGAVITKGYGGIGLFDRPGLFALNAAQIAAGEAVVLFGIGLPMLFWLPKKAFFKDTAAKLRGGEEKQ